MLVDRNGQGTDGGAEFMGIMQPRFRIFALNSLKMLPHMLPRGKNGPLDGKLVRGCNYIGELGNESL